MTLPLRLARMAALVGGERELNYTIHIAENPNFVFFSNPICACSTLKMSLNLSVASVQGNRDFRIDTAAAIHDRGANLLMTPRQLGYGRFAAMLDDPAVPKFAFVRSPESRFLSAFRKKLTRETNFTRKVRTHLGVAPAVPLAEFLTLDTFAAGVAADPVLRDLDEHWRLQRRQIFFDLLPGLTIGFVERFAADAARILGGIFSPVDLVMRDAGELNPVNASATHKAAPSGLSEAARAHVAAAYSEDHAMIAELRGGHGLESETR
jgi:hypothetical protein